MIGLSKCQTSFVTVLAKESIVEPRYEFTLNGCSLIIGTSVRTQHRVIDRLFKFNFMELSCINQVGDEAVKHILQVVHPVALLRLREQIYDAES